MARAQGGPRRPSSGPACRTLSSGSFHAGAPIPTLAGFRRASTHRYQTFPASVAPPAEAEAEAGGDDDDDDNDNDDDDDDGAGGSSSDGSSHEHQQTPLPVRQLLLLAFLSLAEQTALNSISPYLPRMVASTPGIPPGQIGLYVGILASAFALAQLSTNFLWGYASDVVGRKPVLLAGTASLAGCFALFGLCRQYWHIVVVHVAMGLLNGNAACVPTVLGEVTDRSNQSKAFTYLPVIYSIGGITGPALGGLLVGHIVPSHPYLAPNVCAAVLLAVSVAVVALWFEETLEEDDEEAGPWEPVFLHRVSSWLRSKFRPETSNGSRSWSSRWPHAQTTDQRRPLLSPNSSLSSSSADDDHHVQDGIPSSKAAVQTKGPAWRDLLNHTTLLLLSTYLVFQLSNISFNSLYPIFAAAPAPAGRELDPGKIGVSLSFAGLATILFQAFFYQPLKARTGSLGAYRLSLLGIAISMVLMPWVGYLDDEPLFGIGSGRLGLYAQLGLVLVLKNVCAVGGLSSVMLLITNSAPSHASLGTLNGVAQTLSALGRSFGPFVSGGLFSLSLDVRPKGEALAWSVFGGLALAGWICSLFIRGDGLESEDLDGDDESEDGHGRA
ncbi:MFS transporter [Ophiocordyceps camponoti-floridani]|uniref:MFS transporter n=1 Tax=Ophiocordyceps camponoti-floridani TaxID=2030778 RepID=A0A8H4QAF5_9HYPO|nr:MFS transporter [Ophiocordyceps camponoti-floridani]